MHLFAHQPTQQPTQQHSTNTTQHTKHKKGKRLSTHPGDDEQEAPNEKENAGDVGLVLWGRNLQCDSGVSSHGGCHGSACVSWVGSCCLCALPGALTAASHGWLVSRVCGERACGVWVCAWCVYVRACVCVCELVCLLLSFGFFLAVPPTHTSSHSPLPLCAPLYPPLRFCCAAADFSSCTDSTRSAHPRLRS